MDVGVWQSVGSKLWSVQMGMTPIMDISKCFHRYDICHYSFYVGWCWMTLKFIVAFVFTVWLHFDIMGGEMVEYNIAWATSCVGCELQWHVGMRWIQTEKSNTSSRASSNVIIDMRWFILQFSLVRWQITFKILLNFLFSMFSLIRFEEEEEEV